MINLAIAAAGILSYSFYKFSVYAQQRQLTQVRKLNQIVFSMTRTFQRTSITYWTRKSQPRIVDQNLQKSTSECLWQSAPAFHSKRLVKQVKCNGDSLDEILVHKYPNLTETNVGLLSGIIVSGSLYAARNWHGVTLSSQRPEVEVKDLMSL